MEVKYPGYGHFHLTLVMSFADRVCAAVIGRRSGGVEVAPIHLLGSNASRTQLSIVTFNPISIVSNNKIYQKN